MQPLPNEKDEDVIFIIRTARLSKKIIPKLLDHINQFMSQATIEDLSENIKAEIKVIKSAHSLGHSVYLNYPIDNEKEPPKEFSLTSLKDNKSNSVSKNLRYDCQDEYAILPKKKIKRNDSIPSSYQDAVNSPSLVMLLSPFSERNEDLSNEEEKDLNFQSLREFNIIQRQLSRKGDAQPPQQSDDWEENGGVIDARTNYIVNIRKGSMINEEEAESLVKKRNEKKPKLSKSNKNNVKRAPVDSLDTGKNSLNQSTEEFFRDVQIQIPNIEDLEASSMEENDLVQKRSQSNEKSEESEFQKDFGSPVMVYVENEQTEIEGLKSPSCVNEEDEKKGNFCALIMSPGFGSDEKESFTSSDILIDIEESNHVEWIETS